MAGTIYCFNTITDANIYKAGHTQQELSARMRGYMGPSKPRLIVATRSVDDSSAAETLMLSLLRVSSILKPRWDLGHEWFEANEVNMTDRHKAITLLLDTAAKATRTTRSRETKAPTKEESVRDTSQLEILPGMGPYFEALDRFIGEAPTTDVQNLHTALTAFERGANCPIFADYTMWSKGQRLAVARNRHPYSFSRSTATG